MQAKTEINAGDDGLLNLTGSLTAAVRDLIEAHQDAESRLEDAYEDEGMPSDIAPLSADKAYFAERSRRVREVMERHGTTAAQKKATKLSAAAFRLAKKSFSTEATSRAESVSKLRVLLFIHENILDDDVLDCVGHIWGDRFGDWMRAAINDVERLIPPTD